ncbi:MAG: DUF4827 domain-containing protein [Bacteroidaceae bacterium]|nr:DUF4827 domain-containing protein [Bacteroidaceae bacterium]
MRTLSYILRASVMLLMGVILLGACSSDETYADQKERERDAINNFISRDVKITDRQGVLLIDVGRINVISEETFAAQGYRTFTDQNQYVLFNSSGVYMQMVREGVGERLASGETKPVLVRYTEFNIMRDSVQTSNEYSADDEPWVDVMDVTNTSGTFTASFNTSGGYRSKMYTTYGSLSVPAGWLVPFTYVRLGRQTSEQQIAKVRLIVPHSQGHSDASNNVYPCFYELKFQETR